MGTLVQVQLYTFSYRKVLIRPQNLPKIADGGKKRKKSKKLYVMFSSNVASWSNSALESRKNFSPKIVTKLRPQSFEQTSAEKNLTKLQSSLH